MILKAIIRDFENLLLQRFQIGCPGNFASVIRIHKNEISKRKILHDEIPQFHRQRFTSFVDKTNLHVFGKCLIFCF